MKEELYHGLDAEFYDELLDGEIDDLPLWRVLLSATTGPSLEIGCGTGRVMLPLLQEGYRIDGIDSSAKMIELLNDKALGLGVENKCPGTIHGRFGQIPGLFLYFYPRFFFANGCYPRGA